MKPRIFVTQPIEASALAKLQIEMEVDVHPDSLQTISKSALILGIKDKDYLFCRLGDQIDSDVIQANPNLKLIATMATGSGGIDVAEATKLGIPVIGRDAGKQNDGKSGIVEETADLTWALLMAVSRRIVEADRLVRSGVFPGPHSMHLLGAQIHGQNIGIVGMGKIGKAIAKRAKAFGMSIHYYSTHRHPDVEQEFNANYSSLEDLLRMGDYICLHPQYTVQTHHMVSDRQFDLMKPTSFLINTSRGPIVHQEALVRALVSKKIAGAALDVFEGEPHPQLPQELIDLPNVVMTPHIGSAVKEKREIMVNEIVDEIISFSKRRRPSRIFNPEIFPFS